MNDYDFALRPEAGPVPYHSLMKCQKEALRKIIAALSEARQLVAEPKTQGDIVDQDRKSRIFFVSGEPGSGKSSLYFTLRAILSDKTLTEEVRESYIDAYPSLKGLVDTTRWLEQIDLEVAGDERENLLAAVLVRISDVLNDSSDRGVPTACQDAMAELAELENDIGIAWDSNLRDRAPSLDPDSYSQEVIRAQRATLRTNKRLRNALDTLSKEECAGCTGKTLFVLPIDDFYLKPTVSLELLRLLRMISVPRLFFLIMGDVKTMEALFLEKALADWTAVAGPKVFGSLGKRKKQEVLSRAREMSRRYLRKLLPVAQRATMNQMKWEEALRYKPAGNDSPGVPALWQLLADVSIFWNRKAADGHNLLDFLTTPKVRLSLREQKLPNSPAPFKDDYYSALHVLESMPREVMDLWMCLYELKKGQETNDDDLPKPEIPKYMETIFDIVLVAIEEQDFLTEAQQELLRKAFPTGYDARPVDTDRLSIETKVNLGTLNTTKTILWRKHLGWMIRPAGGDRDVEDYLPPRQAAWMILLHDLSFNWDPRKSITKNLVSKVFDSFNLACNGEPDVTCAGWAWYMYQDEWTHFPLPKLNTFRQLDRFLEVWSQSMVDSSGSDSKPLSKDIDIVKSWIRAAWIAEGPEDRYDSKTITSAAGMKSLKQFRKDVLDDNPKFRHFVGEE